jgi:hypothetical protein
LGEGGLKVLTKLSNTIYNTGEWPQDFTEVSMIALKKKTKGTKCSDYSRTLDCENLVCECFKRRAKILKEF